MDVDANISKSFVCFMWRLLEEIVVLYWYELFDDSFESSLERVKFYR